VEVANIRVPSNIQWNHLTHDRNRESTIFDKISPLLYEVQFRSIILECKFPTSPRYEQIAWIRNPLYTFQSMLPRTPEIRRGCKSIAISLLYFSRRSNYSPLLAHETHVPSDMSFKFTEERIRVGYISRTVLYNILFLKQALGEPSTMED
jgi:hypothetical protein